MKWKSLQHGSKWFAVSRFQRTKRKVSTFNRLPNPQPSGLHFSRTSAVSLEQQQQQQQQQFFPIILFILCYQNNQSVTTLRTWSEACRERAWNDNDNQHRRVKKRVKDFSFCSFCVLSWATTVGWVGGWLGEHRMWCINTQHPPL